MRSWSLGFPGRSVRPWAACLIGLPALRPGACPRWLLGGRRPANFCSDGAVAGRRHFLRVALLLLGLCRALGVQAAEPPRPAGPAGSDRSGRSDPRHLTPPGDPAALATSGAAAAAALLAPLGSLAPHPPTTGVDPAALCQMAAGSPAAGSQATSAPAAIVSAGAGAAPPDPAFRGFGDDQPVAAEPPPLVAALGGPAAPSGSPGPGGAVAAASTTLSAMPAQPVQPAAAPPPPPPQLLPRPPQPHPALGFDAKASVPHRPYGKLIYQIARSYALNPLLVAAIAKVESDYNPRARSRKGACGLMQVLPATGRRFGLQRRRDLFNPRKNIETASRYLRWLVDRFGDDPIRVLAAYNAGEGAVDRFGGVPPFAETRGYVTRIFSLLGFTALLDAPVAAAPVATATVPLAAAAAAAALAPGDKK
jgi:soluble lytic murein transglycosylase-like protein